MKYIYAVIGAGRQGTSAAYDMAKFGEAEELFIGDKNLKSAQKSAERINKLLNIDIVQAKKMDVRKSSSLIKFLKNVDSCVSAVPYYFNLKISKAALTSKASICDLGGNTDIVKAQLKLDSEAKEKGISIIPDCGQVPGMGTTLCVYAMSLLDKPSEIYMWDGGLAQNPRPPFNYFLTFNIEG